MKDKDGRDRECQSIVHLAPLFEAVAYTVPPAGAERSHTGSFLKQLAAVKDFPLSAYRVKGRNEAGRIMMDARRTMGTARNSAQISLRVAFRKRGKEQTSQWLTNVFRSK